MSFIEHWIWIIICPIISYLIGSIPFSYIIGKWKSGEDIRKTGNKNVGGLNVMIKSGFKWGIVAGALDFYKGLLTIIAILIIPFNKTPLIGTGTYWELTPHNLIYILSSMAILLGHNYPIYLKFQGGRGIATTVSFLVLANPLLLLIFVLASAFFIFTIKYVRPAQFLAIFVGAPVAFFLNFFPPWMVLAGMDSTFILGLYVIGISLAILPKFLKAFIDMFKGKEYKIGKSGVVLAEENSDEIG